jgi:fucose 4-O-acetylase-like acetyltransferase
MRSKTASQTEHLTGKSRLEWIDSAKGLAILAVVLGHVAPGSRPLYWWHMPCFFFLSGCVFRPQNDEQTYGIRRAKQLMIPYVAWIGLLSIPAATALLIQKQTGQLTHLIAVSLFGGQKLQPPFSAYWFLTGLFLASIAFNSLNVRLKPNEASLACVIAYGLAICRQFFLPTLSFPLEADSVFISLPFIWLGFRFQTLSEASKSRLLWIFASSFPLIFAAYELGVRVPSVDIKNAQYGIPILSPVIALSGTSFCIVVANWIRPLQTAFAVVGKASLTIMLLHQALIVLVIPLGSLPWPATFLIAVTVPLLLDRPLSSNRWTRQILLGRYSNV